MTRFLFWNINRKPLERLIARLAKDHDSDLILLAESKIPPASLLGVLRLTTGERFHYYGSPRADPRDLTTWIQVYARLGPGLLEPVHPLKPMRRVRFYRVHESNPLAIDTILGLIHAPSKLMGTGSDDQRKFFRNLRRSIAEVEKTSGHRKTILVGDLNVDPFDACVAGADGIQGVPTKDLARKGRRLYDNRRHLFFYNPMWGLYGDRRSPRILADDRSDSPDPVVAGTFYLRKNPEHRLYWHMYDQVLVRPALVDRFPLSNLRIIGRVGGDYLVGPKGSPSPSDHLPIAFEVDLRREGEHAR